MLVTNKHSGIDINLSIDGNNINSIDQTKFLGVIIDKQLNWKKHISYVTGKVARGIGIIIKARKYLPKDAILSLYYSFIYPYLTYCNLIWGNACATHLERLKMLQKKVVRIIAGVKPREHTDPIFKQYKLLTMNGINMFLTARFMFKIHHGLIIDTFLGFFKRNREIHSYQTRQSSEYHLPCVHTELAKRNIRFHGVKNWNKLIRDGVTSDCSEAVFKNTLKQLLT